MSRDPRSAEYNGGMDEVGPAAPIGGGKSRGKKGGKKGGKGGKNMEEVQPRKPGTSCHLLLRETTLDTDAPPSPPSSTFQYLNVLREMHVLVSAAPPRYGSQGFSLAKVSPEDKTCARQYHQSTVVNPPPEAVYAKFSPSSVDLIKTLHAKLTAKMHNTFLGDSWRGDDVQRQKLQFKAVCGTFVFKNRNRSGGCLSSGAQLCASNFGSALNNMDVDSQFIPDIPGIDEKLLEKCFENPMFERSEVKPTAVHQLKQLLVNKSRCDVEMQEDPTKEGGFSLISVTSAKSGSRQNRIDCVNLEDTAEKHWPFRLRCGTTTNRDSPELQAVLSEISITNGVMSAPVKLIMQANCYRIKQQTPTDDHPVLGTYKYKSLLLSVSRVTQYEGGIEPASFFYFEVSCPVIEELLYGFKGQEENEDEDAFTETADEKISALVAAYLEELLFVFGWFEAAEGTSPLTDTDKADLTKAMKEHRRFVKDIESTKLNADTLFGATEEELAEKAAEEKAEENPASESTQPPAAEQAEQQHSPQTEEPAPPQPQVTAIIPNGEGETETIHATTPVNVHEVM